MFPRCRISVCVKATVATVILIQLLYIPLTVFLYWNQVSTATVPTTTTTPKLRNEQTTAAMPSNETVERFLEEYEEYCRLELRPKLSNVRAWRLKVGRRVNESDPDLCPCIPDTLEGLMNRSTEVPQIGDMELTHLELGAGGEWLPRSCVPRQRIAIIIPFRDREEHLRALLTALHPMLQRQQLHYTIFVVEQLSPDVFNKASLMNTGFIEARLVANFDCYIFHDVDMIPLHDHNFYTCSDRPRHVGSHLDKFNYTLPYVELFGGVTAFTSDHFVRVNGYSNQYYGWGGEDDDMYSRVVAQNLTITRFASSVARFSMIRHESDDLNPANIHRFTLLYHRNRLAFYRHDGLNSVRYKLDSVEQRPLYMWLQVTLPKHPVYFRNTYLIKRDSASALGPPSSFALILVSLLLSGWVALR